MKKPLHKYLPGLRRETIKAEEVQGVVPSNPPPGQLRVVNLFVDAQSGKLTVQYDDEPEP